MATGKKLVIVESPAKAKTINKYLGKNYKVVASMGHVRDLPRKTLGVDVKKGFAAEYEVLATRKKVLDYMYATGVARQARDVSDADLLKRFVATRGLSHNCDVGHPI